MPNQTPQKMKYLYKPGLVGQCECGHERKFVKDEIDFEMSKRPYAFFKENYICPHCGNVFDGIFEDVSLRKPWYQRMTIKEYILLSVISLAILFGGYKFFTVFNPPSPDFNHMTNKQYNDFMKWEQKQEQQKQDNQPAFNNNQ